jgi:hypothetical protein
VIVGGALAQLETFFFRRRSLRSATEAGLCFD